MRGMYTAGVLDVFMDNNIEIDGIIGTSAGALFGVNYFSLQKGRVIRYNKKYVKDPRYISFLSYFLTGNLVNKKFAFYKMSYKLDPFDNECFINNIKNNKVFYATCTNVETGKAEHLKVVNPLKDMEILRASSALPMASRIVRVQDKKYLDGGVSDSIPIDKFISLGYDKIIVVLTRPITYRKRPLKDKTVKKISKKYKKYPNLIKAMLNRYNDYNNSLEKIEKLEKEGKVFVVRPSYDIDIDIRKKSSDDLQRIYDMGVNDSKKIISSLKKYINKK